MHLQVGDVIANKNGESFASGSCYDDQAVVISLVPLAWTSEGGNTLWKTNLDADKVKVVERANAFRFAQAMRRLKEVDSTDEPYEYRNLPMKDSPKGWHIAGQDSNGGGILEWCRDAEDAKWLLTRMARHTQFTALTIYSN